MVESLASVVKLDLFDNNLRGTIPEEIANIDVSASSVALAALRNATVDLIEELAESNPTAAPFDGWRTPGGESPLTGRWKLMMLDALNKVTVHEIPAAVQRLDTTCRTLLSQQPRLNDIAAARLWMGQIKDSYTHLTSVFGGKRQLQCFAGW